MILVQIWCNTLCDDTHDIHDIARYLTIFTISNGIAKTPRDNWCPIGLTKIRTYMVRIFFSWVRNCVVGLIYKNSAVLFTFQKFYDIMMLIRHITDKLEFVRNYDSN